MARKTRRIFDIDMPQDLTEDLGAVDAAAGTPSAPEGQSFPAGKVREDGARPKRRGPMATAIGEAAASSRERQQAEAQIRAENDALAHEHVRLKRLGLVLAEVPLDAIDTGKLVRDRKPGLDPEMENLKDSIASLGLSNPIRLEEGQRGRYELIQGFRRLSAYKALLEETGDAEAWGRIPAAVAPEGDGIETLYRRMVDENLVRKDISFYEMAQLALDYAADPATAVTDPDKAVAQLFQSARYQKRSYIRAFIRVADRMAGILTYPEALPRALGLALSARIEEDDGTVMAIAAELKDWDNRSATDELAVVRRCLGLDKDEEPAVATKAAPKSGVKGKAKTSFQIDRREGRAKCTAADGRLEIRLARDFSTIDRRRLEEAVRRLLDQLD